MPSVAQEYREGGADLGQESQLMWEERPELKGQGGCLFRTSKRLSSLTLICKKTIPCLRACVSGTRQRFED